MELGMFTTCMTSVTHTPLVEGLSVISLVDMLCQAYAMHTQASMCSVPIPAEQVEDKVGHKNQPLAQVTTGCKLNPDKRTQQMCCANANQSQPVQSTTVIQLP